MVYIMTRWTTKDEIDKDVTMRQIKLDEFLKRTSKMPLKYKAVMFNNFKEACEIEISKGQKVKAINWMVHQSTMGDDILTLTEEKKAGSADGNKMFVRFKGSELWREI